MSYFYHSYHAVVEDGRGGTYMMMILVIEKSEWGEGDDGDDDSGDNDGAIGDNDIKT